MVPYWDKKNTSQHQQLKNTHESAHKVNEFMQVNYQAME